MIKPNATTIAAMKAARAGELEIVGGVDDLLADLNDEAGGDDGMSYLTALQRIEKKTGVELPDWLYHVLRRLKEFRYWFLYRLHPRHRYHVVRTGLPPGYYDQDTRMLHACMALLGDWVEENGGVERIVEWSAELRAATNASTQEVNIRQAGIQDEAIAIHRWWTVERPEAERDKEKALDDWYGWQCDKDPDESSKGKRWEVTNALEKKLAEDDQAYLHRLIEIRPSLWV